VTAMAARPELRLALLLVLFYAGWIKFAADDTDVYLIDYAQRLLIIVLGWSALKDALRRPLPLITDRVWLWAVGGATALIALDTWTGGFAQRAAFDTALFPEVSFPPLENAVWEAVDLTFGLVLVAVSEELVFRRLWADWWDARRGGTAGLYIGSSLVFGLLHLPQGLADTAVAVVWGLLLMALYRQSRCLALVILVHFLVDLWYFT
jgi:membrane protease YdiL (CAAX protease family)